MCKVNHYFPLAFSHISEYDIEMKIEFFYLWHCSNRDNPLLWWRVWVFAVSKPWSFINPAYWSSHTYRSFLQENNRIESVSRGGIICPKKTTHKSANLLRLHRQNIYFRLDKKNTVRNFMWIREAYVTVKDCAQYQLTSNYSESSRSAQIIFKESENKRSKELIYDSMLRLVVQRPVLQKRKARVK